MKPKCPKCGKATLGRWSSSDVACRNCKWTKRVSNAAIIRLATEQRGALKKAYSLGYSHGHEAVMRDRIRDAMEARRG